MYCLRNYQEIPQKMKRTPKKRRRNATVLSVGKLQASMVIEVSNCHCCCFSPCYDGFPQCISFFKSFSFTDGLVLGLTAVSAFLGGIGVALVAVFLYKRYEA